MRVDNGKCFDGLSTMGKINSVKSTVCNNQRYKEEKTAIKILKEGSNRKKENENFLSDATKIHIFFTSVWYLCKYLTKTNEKVAFPALLRIDSCSYSKF